MIIRWMLIALSLVDNDRIRNSIIILRVRDGWVSYLKFIYHMIFYVVWFIQISSHKPIKEDQWNNFLCAFFLIFSSSHLTI